MRYMKKCKRFLVACLGITIASGVAPVITNAEVNAYEERVSGGTWIQNSSSGKWWYKHTDGTYTVNDWEYIDGRWYWFDEYGYMQTGWKQLNGKWYWFGNDGLGYMRQGWEIIDGRWYWFDENGCMQTGWKQLNGKWYWFGNDGLGYMRQGWEIIDGKYYWFDTNGVMVTGNKRISNIDYYFNSSGTLTYDASLAAIYTKNYGSNNINTLPDGDLVSGLIRDDYKIEQYDNFTKSSFTSTNNLFKINNLNRGIFYYSGHGLTSGNGMSLGGGSSISPSELKNMEMNNTKVAFFFACYCGLPNQTGYSMATAAVKAGAKASFAYKIASKVQGDRSVSKLIFKEMMNGKSLYDAVNTAQKRYSNYAPIKKGNVVIAGNKNTKISDTYTIKGNEELYIPEGYVYKGDGSPIELYVLEYNGYETTDKIVYDKKHEEYVFKRNLIDKSRLAEINFAEVEKNSATFDTYYSDKQYEEYFDIIAMVENNPTVVRVCSYIANGLLEYDCIDLQSNQDITKVVDIFEDIM